MSQGLRLVLFGPPGAGKGTQAQMLVDRFGLAHVSSGDIFRHNLREGTQLGLRAREYMDRGELVPDEVVIDIMLDKITAFQRGEGFILDGVSAKYPPGRGTGNRAGREGQRAWTVCCTSTCRRPNSSAASAAGSCAAAARRRSTHRGDSPAPACDRCGGELYQRDDDRPEAVQRANRTFIATKLRPCWPSTGNAAFSWTFPARTPLTVCSGMS